MKTNNILLLASSSPSRQLILRESKIPFQLIKQDADESKCDWNLPVEQVVCNIARYKMEHVVLPDGKEGEVCFVLTSDTLSQDLNGTIHGKPIDRNDAIEKIKAARNGARLYTAFCLDKKQWKNGEWVVETRIEKAVFAQYTFAVPDSWIESYLDNVPFSGCSNAISIENYGWQFLKDVRGSYTSILGLPIFEVREALEQIGFTFCQ